MEAIKHRTLAIVAAAGFAVSLGSAVSAQTTTTVTSTTTQTTVTTTTGPTVIVPQVRRRPPRPNVPAPVSLSAVGAEVAIDDQVAVTSFEFTLTNPSNRPQEAELVVPVPDGVAIRSFQYDGTGSEPTAKLLPRDEARRIYESIVNRERDPALLEFAGYNLIKSSVFPVPAGATQKVRLVYEQVLPRDGDRVDFVLPRSEGAGSISGGDAVWTVGMTIKSSRPISTVYSPSHEFATERVSPTQYKVNLPEAASRAAGAYRLSYLLEKSAGDGLSTTIIAYPDPSVGDGHGGYFLLLAGLPSDRPADRTATRREVVMVLDRSGSMRGEKLEQARNAALQVVAGLENGESFNIIDYSDSIRSFADKPVVKDARTVEQAREYLLAIEAGGGTNLHDAAIESLRVTPTPEALPMVLFMTDGLPTVGVRSEVQIREDVARANTFDRRIFTFGVGFDVNAPLLSALARGSRAASTFVLPQEDVEVKVSQVFRRLSGPAFAAPRLVALDGDGKPSTRLVRDLQAGIGGAGGELPDLFEGDQLVVLGEYTGDAPTRMRLDGRFFGKDRSFEFTLDPGAASTRNGHVPRLWASRKIAALLDEIRQSGANGSTATDPRTKELVDEVVRLSTRFGILTEYTSFLATDPAEVADRRERGLAMPEFVPARAASDRLSSEVKKISSDRAGASGVAQAKNNDEQFRQTSAQAMNCYLDADMNMVRIAGVQQVGGEACLNRGGRWVDTRLLASEQEKPDRVVEFGTPEYTQCVAQLVQENRQGMLAFGGDVYLMLNNQRVLFKNPE
ncbi:MAG: VWA domain-containing protein [Phycisphaeraceae bacterium]|nr:VWA domain-containing protein [Phycisphaeraceae bacterium]